MSVTGRVRASDHDRDRTIESLTDHYAAGRLDLPEFTARMERAQRATYLDELGILFNDLPHQAQPPRASRVPAPIPEFPLLALAGIALLGVLAIGHVLVGIWLPLLAIWLLAHHGRRWRPRGGPVAWDAECRGVQSPLNSRRMSWAASISCSRNDSRRSSSVM